MSKVTIRPVVGEEMIEHQRPLSPGLCTHGPSDFPIRGWGNPPTELQETMRDMFPAKLPFLHEFY